MKNGSKNRSVVFLFRVPSPLNVNHPLNGFYTLPVLGPKKLVLQFFPPWGLFSSSITTGPKPDRKRFTALFFSGFDPQHSKVLMHGPVYEAMLAQKDGPAQAQGTTRDCGIKNNMS